MKYPPCLHTLLAALLAVACGSEKAQETDGDGNRETDPAQNTDTDTTDAEPDMPKRRVTDGSEPFSQDAPLQYHISMPPPDFDDLQESGDDEVYREAALRIVGDGFDVTYDRVGFRLKGSWTLHHCFETGRRSFEDECARLSYKIKFNKLEPDERFFGLKRINLHAMSGEGSKLRERLGYHTFNQFDIIAPRTGYAELFINDEPAGLYLQVEQIDGRFTAFRFPESQDGNLYKEVWPNTGLPEDHLLDHLKTNDNPEDNPDVSDMLGFAEAVASSTEETFIEAMASWVDRDQILRYMAVDRAIHNWDGVVTFYSPLKPHNFYWYNHGHDGEDRFYLIPWDMDNTYWEFDPFMDPQSWVTADPMPDWNVAPASCEPRSLWEAGGGTRATPPGCDRFLNLLARTGWDRFAAYGQALLDGPLRASRIAATLEEWTRSIDDAVAADPFIDYGDWKDEVARLHGSLDAIIADFEDHLTEGYLAEDPGEVHPEPEDDILDAPIPEGGLDVTIINNYEFEQGASEAQPPYVFEYGDDAARFSSIWNTDVPISGTADFRFDFEFHRTDGAWSEWVNVGLATNDWAPADIGDMTEISITMKSDRVRDVRVRVNSPVYETEFGDIWSEFGVDLTVTPEPKIFKVTLARLYYPDWARESWTGDMGWTTNDVDARNQVLSAFNGLIFSPAATRDSEGEMTEAEESGFLQIDNIYFR